MTQHTVSTGRKIIAALVVMMAVLLGFGVFIGGAAVTALYVTTPWLLFAAGLGMSAVVTALCGYLAARLFRSEYPARYSAAGAALFATCLALGTTALLSPSPRSDYTPGSLAVPEGTEFWTLSTGSRIAVRKIVSRSDSSLPPIVFLHGGPGGYSVSLETVVGIMASLADDGYTVYFYDQVGGGLSDRLPRVRDYTLDRHIADLHAIVQRIGAENVVLVGSSFGATLAANYTARHPNHVAAMIVSGAAPMFYPHYASGGHGSIDEVLTAEQAARMRGLIERPRPMVALALAAVNPAAASSFAPDSELGLLFDQVANEFYLPASVCPQNSVAFQSRGFGFWSNRMTGQSLKRQGFDPRPSLRQTDTPVLVVRGACDYKKESVAREYTEVFPTSSYVSLQDAGHMPYVERPIAYLRAVRGFLQQHLPASDQ